MTEELKFPKRRMAKMEPIPSDENFEQQLLVALANIQEAIASVQNTLDVLLHVLTMEEPAGAGDPK